MSSEGGARQSRRLGSPVVPVTARGAALVWLFPGTAEPWVDLHQDAEGERTIGRDTSCAVRLEGNDVSRRHAALSRTSPEGELVIRDLDSRNGIHVNGHQVRSAALGPRRRATRGRMDRRRDRRAWRVRGDRARFVGRRGPRRGGGAAPAIGRQRSPHRPRGRDRNRQGDRGARDPCVERTLRSVHRGSTAAPSPRALAEAELFGYRKGAFTGADRRPPAVPQR